MSRVAAPSSILGIALVLGGCGGGGGGGAPVPPAADLVEITSANAKTVAGAAVLSSLEGGSFGAFALAGTMPSAPAAKSTKTSQLYAKIGAIQGAQTESLVKQSEAGYMQAAVGPLTSACSGGGSVTVSGDLASEQTLTAGDSVTIEFVDCDDGLAVVDGRLSMTITTFEGAMDSGMFSLGVSLELTAFTVVEDGETVAADGDVTMTISAASPMLTLTMTSSSLAVSGGDGTHELSGYSLTQSIDSASGEYSVDASGTVESSAFEGAATFDVTEPFIGSGAAHPGSGELLVSGAGGATLRLIVLDTTFVRLELDTDGNGTVDETVDATWDELT